MFYKAELQFLRSVFKKCHIITFTFDVDDVPYEMIDTGTLDLFGIEPDFEKERSRILGIVEENTIFECTDFLGRSYMFMLLPETEKEVLLIGPYVSEVPKRKEIIEKAEKLEIPPSRFREFESYCTSIPHLPENSQLFAFLDSFGELIWGGSDRFAFKKIKNSDIEQASFAPNIKKDSGEAEKNSWNIKMIE